MKSGNEKKIKTRDKEDTAGWGADKKGKERKEK